MIQHIINIIKGWFTPKEEMDPHEVMLHSKEPDTKLYVEIDGKLKELKHVQRSQKI